MGKKPLETKDSYRVGPIRHFIGLMWIKLTGWQITGEVPPGGKFVLVAAPHTSNWDFPFMLAVSYVFRIRVSWIGKHTLFKGWKGKLMYKLGGIAIDRRSPQGMVEQVANCFRQASELVVVIPPEGTRGKGHQWKSGFYWIAYTAQVPVLCAYMDFAKKKAGVGLSFVPTGNVTADMDRVRAFYDGVQGKFPELTAEVRLKEEDQASA